MGRNPVELHYAVRFSVLAHYFGQLALVAAVLNLVPLAVSLLYGQYSSTFRYVVVATMLALVYLATMRIGKPRVIQDNEAIVLVAGAFLLTPALAWYPLMQGGLGPMDAVFEAVSGVTTTGLSTVGDIQDTPEVFRFTRAWLQWYGGLGVMAFSLAMVMGHGINARRLGEGQPGPDNALSSTKLYARKVLKVYALITLAGIALLLAAGLGPLDAVAYCLSAVSTGGYASVGGSFAHIGGFATWVVTLLTLSCALPLGIYIRIRQKGAGSSGRYLLGSAEPRLLILFCIALGLANSLFFYLDGFAPGEALYHGHVMSISAQSTSGFSSTPVASMGSAQKLLLIFSMMTGAAVGSTGGGFKLLRLLIILRVGQLLLRRVSLSRHALISTSVGGREIAQDEINEALVVVALFAGVTLFSWFIFLLSGYEPIDSLFEVVSAVNTVGLSAGVTASELPVHLKTVLCADMLLGRLEIFAWLIFFNPFTWIGKRSNRQ